MKAAPRALPKKRVMKQESKSTSLGSQSSEDTVTKGLTKKAKIELALHKAACDRYIIGQALVLILAGQFAGN